MRNRVGPPVEGDDFFGREKELSYVWSKMEANNILLPSPRRVGKSSFAKRLLHQAQKEGWGVLEINLEKTKTETTFLEQFVKELQQLTWWRSFKKRGNDFLDSIKKIKPTIAVEETKFSLEWEKGKADIYDEFDKLLDHSKPTLIFLDELGVFLHHITTEENQAKPARFFLHWLRDLRQKSDSRIRWVIGSSVGIENFTHEHKVTDTINDLLSYRLKVFTPDESESLLTKLSDSANVNLPQSASHYIIEKLHYCLPFFLQVIFQKIEELISLEGVSASPQLVDRAYQEILKEKHFNTWVERIDEQYKRYEGDLKVLLKHICQEAQGTSRENLLNLLNQKHSDPEQAESRLNDCLYILTNDGYLDHQEERYIFLSPLLRDFWIERFVK